MQGLLLINKPKGITSFSAVSRVKRAASEKRVGHTGTLDPMATGVLPVFLGRATSLCSLVLAADKKYIAEIKLGITTDTCDITGEVLQEREVKASQNDVENVLTKFKGKINQIPPMYSALKRLSEDFLRILPPKKFLNVLMLRTIRKNLGRKVLLPYINLTTMCTFLNFGTV